MNKQDNARADAMFAEYARGFMAKCAEAGVDPYYAGQMFAVKQAQFNWFNRNNQRAEIIARNNEQQMAAKDPRLPAYAQRRDAGLPGTAIGRLWHNAVGGNNTMFGRAFGVRSGDQYAQDKADARANAGGEDLALDDQFNSTVTPVGQSNTGIKAGPVKLPQPTTPSPTAPVASAPTSGLRLRPNSKSVNQTIVGRRL